MMRPQRGVLRLVWFSFVAIALVGSQTPLVSGKLCALQTRLWDFSMSSCSLNFETEIGIAQQVLFGRAQISYRLFL
tara:strand:- start:279 stop:506 length:228 start_codon:yes stop_codon:yes gene_type:complete